MRSHGIAAALLALLVTSLYANGLDGPFVFDDLPNIYANPAIRISQLDAAALWRAAVDSPEQRPVASLSFALNYYAGGYAVRGYHVVNVAIHLVNGWIVYGLALALFRGRSRRSKSPIDEDRVVRFAALVTAALFVAHPIQTQAVTYVVQRMASLSSGFTLLAFWLFVLGRGRTGAARSACWLASLVAFGLGLGSKEIAITLPVAALLYEWLFHAEVRAGWLRRRGLWIAAIGAVFAAAALVFLHDAPLLDYSRRDFDLGERLLTQLRVVVHYVGLLLLPHPAFLNLDHHVAPSHSLLDPPTTLLCGLGLLGAFVLALRLERVERLFTFAILWFFLQLAVESSIFPLEMMFEHRLYLPMLGFALLVASGLAELAVTRSTLAAVLAVAIVGGLGVGTHLRNEVWRDALTLWSDALSKSPDKSRPINNVAAALLGRGQTSEAEALLQRALTLDPDYHESHYNLGNVARARGEHPEAIARYRRALELVPDLGAAHNNLASTLRLSERPDEALVHYREAHRLLPESAVVLEGLAWMLATHPDAAPRDPDRAIALAERATRLTLARVPEVLDTLGAAYAAAGRYDEAVRATERALDLAKAGRSPKAEAIQARLTLYRAEQPYRMGPYIERR